MLNRIFFLVGKGIVKLHLHSRRGVIPTILSLLLLLLFSIGTAYAEPNQAQKQDLAVPTSISVTVYRDGDVNGAQGAAVTVENILAPDSSQGCALAPGVPTPSFYNNWVVIDDIGNPKDGTAFGHTDPDQIGYGKRDYEYQVTRTQITMQDWVDFLNAVDPSGLNNLGLGPMSTTHPDCDNSFCYSPIVYSSGSWRVGAWNQNGVNLSALEAANLPMEWLSLNNVAHYMNWLATGSMNTGAFTFSNTSGQPVGNWDIATFDATFPGPRIPLEDELYKAMFWNKAGSSYNLYPTANLSGSKTITGAWPTNVDLTTGSHTLRAEIYEGGSWLYRTATFGPCAAAPSCSANVSNSVSWMNQYNLTVLDNLQGPFNETEGRTFVGNDFTSTGSSNFAIAMPTSTACTDRTFVVAGSIVSGYALNVNRGSLAYGNSYNGRTINFNGGAGCGLIKDTSLSDAEVTANVKNASTFLAGATPNNADPTVDGSGNLVFNVTTKDSNGLAVFDVTAAQVFANSSVSSLINFNNTTNATTILINVSGTTVNWTQGQLGTFLSSGSANIGKVIWNFHQATSINTNARRFAGAMLAPLATVNPASGNLEGSAVVKTLQSTGEIHLPVFGLTSAAPLTGVCGSGSIDYGDAPDTGAGTGAGNYNTLASDSGPSHVVIDDLRLGAVAPDGDAGTLQNTAATADNIDNINDEEGVSTLPSITPASTSVPLSVSVFNNTGGSATLACWLDFNRDGDFLDIGERAVATVSSSASQQTKALTFTGFATPTTGVSYLRCRLANATGDVANPTGAAATGEVEDYQVTISLARDFGDAPDTGAGTGLGNYNTVTSDSGPSHVIVPNLKLGANAPDGDDGTLQNAAATADDTTDTDDEDGVTTLPTVTTASASVPLNVSVLNNTGSEATLACWLDFNRDGDFLDIGERAVATVSSSASQQTKALTFTGFATPTAGVSYLRCRLASASGDVANPTGLAGTGEVEDYQVTITQSAAIGDYVWYDADKDGVQDVGEPGIGNVTLNLYKDNGDNVLDTAQDTLVGTTTTDNDGGYLFTELGPGVYFVDVTDTHGALTGQTHTLGVQSQPDPSNAITLNVGDVYRDADFGYVQSPTFGKAIIGDTVWYDGDGDGVQDPGEPGIPGVEVCATPVGGGMAVCDTTDQNGIYRVEVLAGTYTVAPTNPPAGYTATTPVPHGPVTVSPGDRYLNADFGYDSPALGTISGTIWDDSPNKNGLLEGGEQPIPGVSVSLIQDTNNNGQWDAGEPIIATDTTDQDGNYLFDGVLAGNYLVLPTDTQNVLDDFSPTVAGPNPGSDNNNQVKPYPVNLPAGGNNPTGDFGYVRNGSGDTAFLGNQVWYEEDGNGIFNPESGDKGIAGVTVDLYKSGVFQATTTTGAGGDYVFTSLAAGTYTVRVSDTAKVLEDYILTVLGPAQGSDNNNQKQAYQVVLLANSSNMTADFGYTRPSSIGDLVWYDADKDGIEDVGEPGIANVTVDLYRDGVYQATTTTDADGGYIFPGLVAGNYTVDVTDINGKLTGMTQIVANQGQPDPTAPITLGAGEAFKDADFAYVKPTTPGKAIIGDTVWYDDNGDGVQQPNEPGISGVQVCATPVAGGAAICATTDTNGIYRVEVPAGTYTVQPTNPPAGFTATTPVPHGPVTVDAGEQYLDADFGYDDPGQNLLGTIGNLVFLEAKATKDGLYNGADKPLAGVSVDLIRDTNNNKTWDVGEPIIATTTTAGTTDANSGNYLFTGLSAGNYLVHVSDTNAVLLDYKKTIPGPNPGVDNNNQVDPYAITLGLGGDNLTADFGYYQTERPDVGVLGNQVWIETDGNGLFDVNSGDMGQPGVTVKLLKDGVLYATTTSGPSGDYSFVGLPAGNYTTQVTDDLHVLASYTVTKLGPNQSSDNNNQLQPYATALPTGGVNLTGDFGYILPAAIGDYIWYDTNGNGVQDVGEPGLGNVTVDLLDSNGVVVQTTTTDANGGYLFNNLPADTYTVDVTDLNGILTGYTLSSGPQSATDPTAPIVLGPTEIFRDADFGYRQPTAPGTAVIGDTVWWDNNQNGVRDPGELGIPGITVELKDPSGTVISTTVTNENGNYLFSDVTPGTYRVDAVTPPGDPDPAAPDPTALFTVSANQQYLDADIGRVPVNPATIGGTVWNDTTPNGVLSGEPGLPGVTVDLLDTSGKIIATTTTDSNGTYTFTVPAGSYEVQVSDTHDLLDDFTDAPLGPNPGVDNNNQAQPYAVTVVAGQTNTTADFGYVSNGTPGQTGVIGNQVWVETDRDGIYEPLNGEIGVAGVTVELLDVGGTVVFTTTTGADGGYVFSSLPAGTYQVQVSDTQGVLASYSPTLIVGGTADNTNKDQPYSVVLADGEIDTSADFGYMRFGSIGDFVWYDTNGDGVQDGGEPGIPGVVISLTNSIGQIITTTTDANGIYSFTVLADTYTVTVASGTPSGANPTSGPQSQTSPYPVTLSAGQSITDADFGYKITPAYALSKDLLTDSPARTGSVVQFRITITNTGDGVIDFLPLADTYDELVLRYVTASTAPEDSISDGTLDWADLTTTLGDLLPGQVISLTVSFEGLKDTGTLPGGNTENVAAINGATVDPDGAGPLGSVETLPPVADSATVVLINPTNVIVINGSVRPLTQTDPAQVEVSWETVSELEIAGFHVYRLAPGEAAVRLTEQPMLSSKAGQAEGDVYKFVDNHAVVGVNYAYELELLPSNSQSARYQLGTVVWQHDIFLPLVVR